MEWERETAGFERFRGRGAGLAERRRSRRGLRSGLLRESTGGDGPRKAMRWAEKHEGRCSGCREMDLVRAAAKDWVCTRKRAGQVLSEMDQILNPTELTTASQRSVTRGEDVKPTLAQACEYNDGRLVQLEECEREYECQYQQRVLGPQCRWRGEQQFWLVQLFSLGICAQITPSAPWGPASSMQ